MEVEVLTTLISTVGFPIAVSVALFWTMKQMGLKALDTLNEFKDAINKNTNSIIILTNQLNRGSDNVRIDK